MNKYFRLEFPIINPTLFLILSKPIVAMRKKKMNIYEV